MTTTDLIEKDALIKYPILGFIDLDTPYGTKLTESNRSDINKEKRDIYISGRKDEVMRCAQIYTALQTIYDISSSGTDSKTIRIAVDILFKSLGKHANKENDQRK